MICEYVKTMWQSYKTTNSAWHCLLQCCWDRARIIRQHYPAKQFPCWAQVPTVPLQKKKYWSKEFVHLHSTEQWTVLLRKTHSEWIDLLFSINVSQTLPWGPPLCSDTNAYDKRISVILLIKQCELWGDNADGRKREVMAREQMHFYSRMAW